MTIDQEPTTSRVAAGPQVPTSFLVGRAVELRPVTPKDYEALQVLEESGELLVRGRLGGHTPSPDDYAASLHAGVLAQFIVVDRRNAEPVGLVSSYAANHAHQYAYMGMWRFAQSQEWRDVRMMHGMALFLDYLFARWPFRKLYGECAEYNYHQFASGVGGLFEEEGRLRDHVYFAGQYWDKVILALYRDEWSSRAARVMPFIRSNAVHAVEDEQVPGKAGPSMTVSLES